MQLASLPYKNSLDFYDEEWMYTFSRLSEDPRCAALLPAWKALESQWIAVQAQQRFLNLAIVQAQQRVDLADDELDRVVDLVDDATKKKQPPVHPLLFKVAPHVLKRPVLGRQLKTMAVWPPILIDSGVAAWAAFAPMVQGALDKGASTEQVKHNAAAANTTFRAIGERKVFVDNFNALRDKTFIDLAQLAKDHDLGADWPPGFFRRRAAEYQTAETLTEDIEVAETDLAALKLRLQTILAAQSAAEDAAKTQIAAQRNLEIAALKKTQADAAARLVVLEGEHK